MTGSWLASHVPAKNLPIAVERSAGSSPSPPWPARHAAERASPVDCSRAHEEGVGALTMTMGVLYMSPGAGTVLLRDLLRRLTEVGRRDVSIVIHRAP